MNMLLVFPIVLGSYAALHVYLVLTLRRAFPSLRPWTPLLASGALILFIGPFLTRFFGNRGYDLLARLAGLAGYTWIAAIFWFSAIGLCCDAWNLLVRIASAFSARAARAHLPASRAVQLAGALVVVAMAWGLIEARGLKIETVALRTDRLPAGHVVRVVQLADLHLGAPGGGGAWRRAIRAIEALAPDVVVSTGDLTDAPFERVREEAEAMRRVLPAGRALAVLGNHEFYTRLGQSIPFHEAAGFTLLRGRGVEAAPGLWVAGVDDPAGLYTRQSSFTDERPLAGSRPRDAFVVLLKHQPLVSEEAGAWFDLQLSGHTHGGQLFPFELALKLLYPRRRGLHEVGWNRHLYISRGAGTWGPPMRLFARPEITLFLLEGGAGTR